MGSYIESTLGRDEKIIYRAQVSWLSQFWHFLFGILLLMAFVGIVFIIAAILNVMTTELALTNKKVVAKFGFIRRSTVELNLDKIESISVDQGIMGRIFNYGSIIVRGTGGGHAPIPYIARPLEFRQHVNEMLDEKNRLKQLS